MKAYACHKGDISYLILESPSTSMTAAEWVWVQKADPAFSQVTTWIDAGKVGTVKVSEEMSQEVRQYFKAEGTAVLESRILILTQRSDMERLQ